MVRLSSTIWPSSVLRSDLRLLQRIFVGPGIDLKQQAPLLDEFVVLHRQVDERAIDLGSDADEVGKYLCIIGARVLVGHVDHQQAGDQRCGDDAPTLTIFPSVCAEQERSVSGNIGIFSPIQLKNSSQIVNV